MTIREKRIRNKLHLIVQKAIEKYHLIMRPYLNKYYEGDSNCGCVFAAAMVTFNKDLPKEDVYSEMSLIVSATYKLAVELDIDKNELGQIENGFENRSWNAHDFFYLLGEEIRKTY